MAKLLIAITVLSLVAVLKAQELSTSNPNAASTVKNESRNETRTTRRPQWQGTPIRRTFVAGPNQPTPENPRDSEQVNPHQPQRSANMQAPGIDARSGTIANQAGLPQSYYGPAPSGLTGQQPAGRQSHQARSLPTARNVGYRPRSNQEQPTLPAQQDQSGINYLSDDVSFKPYSFNYVSDAEDGQYSHQQSADESGKVIGSYSFILEDGRRRVVEYVADHNGFRANIDSNEPGMSVAENPADVSYYSAANYPSSNTGRGVSGPSTYNQRGSSSYGSSQPGVRNYLTSSDEPYAPDFTSYRTQGTDSEFRSDRGIQDDYRGRRDQSPAERSFVRSQSGRAADSIPRSHSNVPSNDGRVPVAPVGVGAEETPDINALPRSYQPAVPEPWGYGNAPAARAPQPSVENTPRSQTPRYNRRQQDTVNSPNAIGSSGQPDLRTPSVRSYFHLGSDATRQPNQMDQGTPTELGPAMSSFLQSRPRIAEPRPVSDERFGRDGPAAIPTGLRTDSRFGPSQEANQRNDGQIGNQQATSDSADGADLRYQTSNNPADLARQGNVLPSNVAPSDTQNTPLVEYHALHPDGSPQYFYSVDNGQYWFHRH